MVHAYLASFRSFGLVVQDVDTGSYRLGASVLDLGLAYLRSHDPLGGIWRALPHLRAMVGPVPVLVMSVWSVDTPVVVRSLEPLDPIHANVRLGKRLPLTDSGTGHLFATFMPKDLIARLINR